MNEPTWDYSQGIDPLGDIPTVSVTKGTAEMTTSTETDIRYLTAKIVAEPEITTKSLEGEEIEIRTYRARIEKADGQATEVEIKQNSLFVSQRLWELHQGDRVVLAQSFTPKGEVTYALVDQYRLPALGWVVVLFLLLVVAFGRWRGLMSVLGMLVSAAIIIWFIVPRIAAGADPLWTSLFGSLLIATVSLFLAHGFNRRTLVAYGATVFTLLVSCFMAVQAVAFTRLVGLGTEESGFALAGMPDLNLRGLLLAGILLGLLGVLDDITTAQSAVVEELKRANLDLGFVELYRRGLSVGREHIASLINTLFLAYAGASLPLFLLFSLDSRSSLWMILNNELIAEEIVRTLVGSACLILAVPIATALAAYVFQRTPVLAEPECF